MGSPTSSPATESRLIQLIQQELVSRDQIIKDIVTDYNKQIDNLTSRQDSLLNIIKELIKKIEEK